MTYLHTTHYVLLLCLSRILVLFLVRPLVRFLRVLARALRGLSLPALATAGFLRGGSGGGLGFLPGRRLRLQASLASLRRLSVS